jgi:septation ring formation regulator EzrA
MNIQTVRDNLKNTIAGKEKHLAGLQECIRQLDALDDQGDTWFRATVTVEFLAINIDELKRILQDVESCVAKDVEQSWRDNPDRSGGQFTQEEIDNANRW